MRILKNRLIAVWCFCDNVHQWAKQHLAGIVACCNMDWSKFAPEINLKHLEKKIRVAAVSYLNTKPLIYGFEKGGMKNEIELTFDYPARVAGMLINNEADIGLIPVAAIPRLEEHYIISDYGIGASGPVASVCLFSQVPVNEIEEILLDYQSRTSVALLKILLKEYWQISPALINTVDEFQDQISESTAGLVIGDRALTFRKKAGYVYDLAKAWQDLTGLPFVFAAWVANKKLPETFTSEFNAVTSSGLDHLPEIIRENPFADYDLSVYYSSNIDFKLDDKKKEGLALFLAKLKAHGS